MYMGSKSFIQVSADTYRSKTAEGGQHRGCQTIRNISRSGWLAGLSISGTVHQGALQSKVHDGPALGFAWCWRKEVFEAVMVQVPNVNLCKQGHFQTSLGHVEFEN